MNLVLASASERRQAILTQFGFKYQVILPQIKEKSHGTPHELALGNAIAKASAICCSVPNVVVIGADTIVVLNNEILGKPRDRDHARETLIRLSGKIHQVITGVAICNATDQRTFYQTTDVYFRDLAKYEIEAYINTDEPFDKAGSYGIQGIGGAFVESISGCYYNVVGLPITRLILELRHFGFDPFAQGDN